MKHKFLLIVIFLLTVCNMVQAQKVTLDFRLEKLGKVMEAISKQTGKSFSYSRPVINPDAKVSISVKNEELSTVLAQIIDTESVEIEITDKKIFLKPFQKRTSLTSTSEQKRITGQVSDASGEALIGASVSLKGSAVGTATDVNGQFSLNVPVGSSLLVSYLGYISKEVKPGENSNIQITLQEDARSLDEVVVVGYGVQNKRDVSTSISSVQFETLSDVPVSDFRNALVGKMPGVMVLQPSGDPNATTASIRVRGISTITAGSEPLYVIDGIPMERGLSNINSNDIETIDVLKDASSAAIYGSRGSNGVVLITTKRGKSAKLNVQYDGYFGVQTVSKKIAMMDAYQFAQAAKDGHDNAYLDANPNGSADDPNSIRPNSWERIPPELFPYLNGEQGLINTDWQDAIFRSAQTNSHNISLSGKTDKVNYFVSANYLSREGIVIGSGFEKYSARLNLDATYDKFKYGINFSPSYSVSNRVDASGVNGVVQSALTMPPTWPVYNEDGSYNYQGNGYWRVGTDYQHNAILNPVAQARLQSDVVDRIALVGNLFAEYEFFKGFSYHFSLGGDYYGAHNDRYRSSTLPLLGYTYLDKPSNPTGYSSSAFYFNWLVENKFSYKTVINDSHSINAILVQSAQKETYLGNNVEATDYPNDYVQTISGGIVNQGSSNKTQWTLASYLARAQYSYQGRYLLSASIRADGSSRFGSKNRWGYFPSASAAWRLSDEDFFKNANAFSFIDDFKVRGSYGETGNFNIGNYDHLSVMSKEDYILGAGDGKQTVGYKPDNIKNNTLKWEKNTMLNAGIDLQMMKGLIGLTVEYYDSQTSDMLLTVPVPRITGHNTALMNIGSAKNYGWELLLTSRKLFANGFEYNFSANYAKNNNEVTSLGTENAPIISTGSVDHAYYITQVGQPIGSYYVLVQDGIFATAEELKKYPHFDNTRVGDFRYVDVDGDGVLDLDKDRAVVGNYMPKFTYGFSGQLAFKGVDFSFDFQGVYGNKILNLNQRYINSNEGNTNEMIEGLNRWKSETDPGDGNTNRGNRKATGYNGRTSTWHIEDGSYFRLQNITLGYTLPQKVTQKLFLQKLRIYVSGQNLWTHTKYTGYNPEVNARPDKSTTPGEDYGTYPLAKVCTFGLNITF
ncbi:MAG: TonB-dependent receptor [Candidatus Symbiothrix sp.]|jgi:TonB-linked SusC/RagA family outer membrane protein|nr:TonB-dependent receptor [Candidatus Symbiothrix sp.]